MTLQLDRYQADMPYPVLRNVLPDKGFAAKLTVGYSGETSEVTTVLQYAHHSLRCKRRYEEIFQLMRGIFYVETLHMELLGECVLRLGGDVRYNVALREKSICWQASLINYGQAAGGMLLADIQGEKGAADFYEQAAAEAKQPEVAALLSRLAEDEKLHLRMLSDMYKKYFRR